MELAFAIILLVAAVFLVVAVLMQHGKSHNLSGTIAGGSETFFGKSKSQTIDKKLSRLTTVVAIVFVVLVIIVYVVQEDTDYTALFESLATADTTSSDTVADTDADTDADTAETEAPADTDDAPADTEEAVG